MTVADHPFEVPVNPRKARSCAICGRIPEWHPAPEPAVERDVEGERQILLGVLRPVLADPDEFIRRAHARAHPGPIADFATRDFDEDGIEEALDGGGNYTAWGIRQARWLAEHGKLDPETAHQKVLLRAEAMKLMGRAYQCLRQAQAL